MRGGQKFERVLEELAQKLRKAKTVRVGFLEGATYPDGTPVPLVAAVQDFGAPSRGIPPRPFFRNMVAAKKGEWPAALEAQLKATNYDARQALDRVGQGIAGQLRQSIADFEGVPLKPATIKRKGSSKQLVDTGHLLNSVDHEVK